jgi:Sigma-70, region 4
MDAIVDFVVAGDSGDMELDKTVREALDKLEEQERALVERRYLMGQSYACISAELECSEREIERGLREATLKLRRLLAPFVAERFNIRVKSQRKCLICDCADREGAERIIVGKRKEETWKRVMRELRQRVGLKIDSPQALIGHVKYHPRNTKREKTNRKDMR